METRYVTLSPPAQKDSWALILIIFLFAAGLVAMIYLYFKERKTCVDISSIPKIKGNYGVQQGLAGKALQTCGTNGNKPCVFSAPNSISAFNMCSTVPSICSSFSYEPLQGIVTFINEDEKFDPNPLVMTFVRQVAIDTKSSLAEQQIVTDAF